MGKHKAISSSKSSDNPHRKASDIKHKGGKLRDKATINRLKMYRGGKPIRDKKGKIVGGTLMMRDRAGDVAITAATGRIQPDRRWFGNTRIISQDDLDRFREEMTTRAADPFSVVLRRKKIPMGLLVDSAKAQRMNLLETEAFADTFGGKSTRKRPKLSGGVGDYAALLERAEGERARYQAPEHKDTNIVEVKDYAEERRHDLFEKGQSKRIWGELYKVLDSSDVVIQVLDARNIPGTRCAHLERHLKKNAAHKHLILIVNKCDLVPAWAVRKWVKLLNQEHPTLAFHASLTNAFGKGALINLLRQYAKLHQDKKQISVGVVGYPNVGKSSIINTLKSKKVCKVAPVPGETKVWQYITLMKRIYLIDCPGIVYDEGDDEAQIVMKGVVRAERLPDPTEFVGPILAAVKKEYVTKTYGIKDWEEPLDFMTKLAKKTGKLVKGGEPDLHTVAVALINDYQRGKLPHFVAPPRPEGDDDEDDEEGEGEGALQEAEQEAEALEAAGGADAAAAASGDEASSSGAEEEEMEAEAAEEGAKGKSKGKGKRKAEAATTRGGRSGKKQKTQPLQPKKKGAAAAAAPAGDAGEESRRPSKEKKKAKAAVVALEAPASWEDM